MIMRTTLLGAVGTDFGTQTAVGCRPLAVSGHHFQANLTAFDALQTAIRAVVHAFFRCHFRQADLAINQALLAGFNATHVRGIDQGTHLG